MSRNLPTFQVSDEQFERIMNVFGGTEAYRAWLRWTVVNECKNQEYFRRQNEMNAQLDTEISQRWGDLDAPLPEAPAQEETTE